MTYNINKEKIQKNNLCKKWCWNICYERREWIWWYNKKYIFL